MSAPVEIRKLNSLRGLAALIVLISHYSNESGLWGTALGNGAGQFGVMIFFLLSAFLISYLYLDTPPTPRSVTNFAIARIARVMPLFLITVIVSFAVIRYLPSSFGAFVYNIPDVNALLSHLLLLRGEDVLWTIPPEIHFYMFFAIAWVLWPYLKIVLYGVVAILLASIVIGKGGLPLQLFFGFTATHTFIKVFPYFAVGFLLGHLFRHWRPRAHLCSHYYVIALLVIPLLYPDIFFYLTGQHHGIWKNAGILTCVSAVFFVVVFFVPDKNWVLENRVGDLLGRISYSLYLLHHPLLLFLKSLGLVTGIGGLVLFFLLAAGLAYISLSAFELPMRRWIKSVSFPDARPEPQRSVIGDR